ncbi:hypothetical protein C0V97_07405 [Asaia sp. W19]|nr:hypothetical protein C0V97_07405 [Asaia sp. W19]
MLTKLLVLCAGLGIAETLCVAILSGIGEWLADFDQFNGSLEKLTAICEISAVLSFSGATLFGFLKMALRPGLPSNFEKQDITSG